MKNSTLIVLLIIAMFFWGASWSSSKILISYAPAYIIAFWRFFFVILGLFFILIIFKISFKFEKKALKFIIIAGALNAFYSFLLFVALHYGNAGKAGVLSTTMIPIFSYILFILTLKIKGQKLKHNVKNSEFFGLFLGLISGLCLLNLNSIEELFGKFNTLFLLTALIWAIMTIFTHQTKGTNPMAVNFYINLTSLICFTPVLFMPHTLEVFSYDAKFWANLFVLAFLSTAVGTSIYYFAIYKLGNIRANSFVLITPAAALFTSFVFLNEIPSLLTLFGCVLAILAIYFINIYSKK